MLTMLSSMPLTYQVGIGNCQVSRWVLHGTPTWYEYLVKLVTMLGNYQFPDVSLVPGSSDDRLETGSSHHA